MAKKLIALVLVFVSFYMGAHYWLRWRSRVTDNATKTTRLVECEPNSVRKITLRLRNSKEESVAAFHREDVPRAGVPAAVQLADAVWRMDQPEQTEADAALLTRISSMVCALYDPIPARGDDWREGEAGGAKLGFTLADGSEHSLHFGGLGADRLSVVRYRAGGAERLVRIPVKLFQLASLAPRTFVNLRLARIAPDNTQTVKFLVDGKERFSLEREGAGWQVLVGGKALGAGSAEADRFLNRLLTLKGMAVEKMKYPAAECARGSARFLVELTGVAGRSERLYFRPAGKARELLACNSERDALLRVHADLWRYLDIPAKKMLAKR